jgi:transposase
MIGLPAGVRIWLAAGFTDLRKGIDGLCALIQTALGESATTGQIYVFRGRRVDKIKVLWADRDGLCLFMKRLRDGRFTWPQATSGRVLISAAQLSMLLDGIDWRRPRRSAPMDPDPPDPTLTA